MAPQPHSPRTQSPLTRGKHPAWILRVIASRLIPAHAGKTPTTSWRQAQPGAHPRSRGENCGRCLPEQPPDGSSPLTRGKLGLSVSFGLLWRLIPAHAGKTRCGDGKNSADAAHPRSRGENQPQGVEGLGWGAHPRSRGENTGDRRTVGHEGGSSPLTRGKRAATRGSNLA